MSKIKLSSRTRLPASVKQAQKAYKDSRKNLLIKSYTKPLKARTTELKRNFKLNKAFGVLFSALGIRMVSDYKKMKTSGIKELKIIGLNARLQTVGNALTAEMAKNPALRNSIKTIAKEYPYLILNKKGEVFVSSFDGNIIDPNSFVGKVFSKSNVIPSKKMLTTHKKGLVRLNLNDLVSRGNPKFESAVVTTKKIRGKRITLPDAVVSGYGHKEVKIFVPSSGGRNASERTISSNEVRRKSILSTTDPKKKLVKLLLNDGEVIRITTDKKKAEGMFKGLKLGL